MTVRLVGAVAGYEAPASLPATFSIACGEVVGLTGSNGIGKSTLLKAVLGTANLFAGQILKAPDLRISYLPQHPVRLPALPLTGHELLSALGAGHLIPPQRLAPKLPMRVDRLSGGEYQLLMLWATLCAPAGLMLLDEPTNNLDASHIETAIAEIGNAHPQRASLIVSHDRPFLDAVCTRIETMSPAHD